MIRIAISDKVRCLILIRERDDFDIFRENDCSRLEDALISTVPTSTTSNVDANNLNLGKKLSFNHRRSIEHERDSVLIVCRGSLIQSDSNYCIHNCFPLR